MKTKRELIEEYAMNTQSMDIEAFIATINIREIEDLMEEYAEAVVKEKLTPVYTVSLEDAEQDKDGTIFLDEDVVKEIEFATSIPAPGRDEVPFNIVIDTEWEAPTSL